MKYIKCFFPALLALLLGNTLLHAQEFHVQKSEIFEEPESGNNRLLQLKNGNTVFFHTEEKEDGFDVTVYDKSRKLVAKRRIPGELWFEKIMTVKSFDNVHRFDLYEINGEPVIFLMENGDDKATLHRIRLSPDDGSVLKDEVVATLAGHRGEKYMIWNEFAGMLVQKDPYSDCYAVIAYDMAQGEWLQSIKVMHFDGTHKLLGQGQVRPAGKTLRNMRYSSAYVNGDKCVYIGSLGFPKGSATKSSEPCKMVISGLKAGDTAFANSVLDMNVELREVTSQLLYNRGNDQLQMRILSFAESKYKQLNQVQVKYYFSLVAYIDPATLDFKDVKPLLSKKVNEYAQAHIDKEYSYSGNTTDMLLNKDNTTAILMEESSSGSNHADLGAIGITILSDTGSELSGYAITKKQVMYGTADNYRFMSYNYISAPKGNYVIFNDLVSNIEKDESDTRIKKVAGASVTNTVAYKLGNNSINRLYLFGEPANDKTSLFSYTKGDYNSDLNTYATVLVERDGRKKTARIAWVTFD